MKDLFKYTRTAILFYQSDGSYLVEARGVEPLSEDQTAQTSPSAVRVLTFPPPDSHERDSDFSSFINPPRRKA